VLRFQDDVAFKVSDDPTGNVRVHFGSDAAESSPPVTLVAGPVVVAPAVAVADAKPLPAVIVEVPQAPIVAAAVVPPPPVVTPLAPAMPSAPIVQATPLRLPWRSLKWHRLTTVKLRHSI